MDFNSYVTGGQGGIPWAQAAAFFVELRDVTVPEPVLTKQAAAGLLKLARIRKVAQTPEEEQKMTREAAMTDPNVVEALDYQEMAAEREALQQTVQAMQQQVMQSAQTQQAAEQQVQELAASTEALQGQLEQANAGRQQAIEQAVMAKDEALSEVVNQQQHRAQIMQTADQLAMQLKQVAATSPNEARAQQQAAMEQGAPAGQEAAAGAEGEAASAKTQQEAQQAQQAQVDSQVQAQQAQQAQQQDAAKMQAVQAQQAPMAVATQEQQGAAGSSMPKQGSAQITPAQVAFRESRAKFRSEQAGKRQARQADRAGLGPMSPRSSRVEEAVREYNKRLATGKLKIREDDSTRGAAQLNQMIMKPKTASVAEAAQRILEKRAYFYLKGQESTAQMKMDAEVDVARPEWSREIGRKKREHFENFMCMAEEKKGKPLTVDEANALVQTYNKATGSTVPLAKDWLHGHLPYNSFEKTAAPLGIAGRLAYMGGGAAVGGAHAGAKQYMSRRKYGPNAPTNDEIDRGADYMAASIKARRDPTYLNKIRAATAKFREDMQRADRQHPGGAILRGATTGAMIGGIGGQAFHTIGGRVKGVWKARQAAAQAAKQAVK